MLILLKSEPDRSFCSSVTLSLVDNSAISERSIQLSALVVGLEAHAESWGGREVGWTSADSVEEALETLSRATFDAVVFDADLGPTLEALALIRERAPFAGLVVVGDRTTPELAFNTVHYGAHEFLSKPGLTQLTLENAVRRAIDRRWLAGFAERRETLLDAVFRSIATSIAVVDASGTITMVNGAWERDRIGLGIGDSYVDFLEQASERDLMAKAAVSGLRGVLVGSEPSFHMEYPRRSESGERWYSMQIDPMPYSNGGVAVTHTDITERRSAENALVASEIDLRRLIEGFPVGVAVIRDGRFAFLNRALLDALGHPDDEQLLGRPWLEIVDPSSESEARTALATAASGGDVLPWDLRARRGDGGVKTFEIRSLEARFEGKASTLLVAQDVSERRAITTQMMQIDRMMSVGLLAAGLGHEINNPLSFVTANVDLALRSAADLQRTADSLAGNDIDRHALEALLRVSAGLEEIREALSDAREGARRVQSIARDLKTFARPVGAKDGPVELEAVLEATLHVTWNEIRHRARLVKEYSSGTVVLANDAHLGQVFLNLVTNAVHAIGVGAADRNEIRVELQREDDWAVVKISDTGCGIDEEVLPRIFDPFFTSKPMGQGSGLGLSIVRNIVTSLGGTLEVKSLKGKGTTVVVRLKTCRDQLVRAPSTMAPLEEPERSLSILVVDDEPLIARVVTRSMGRGHQLLCLSGGKEALAELESDRPYDVVFLDVMMPDMTGVEVYRELEKRAPHRIPHIAFLTGGAFTQDAREFLERVSNPTLGKPFEARALRELAASVASRAEVSRTSPPVPATVSD